MRKLGLIAGGGTLPLELAAWRAGAGLPQFVIRLKGFAEPELARYDGADLGVAELGRCFDALTRAGCDAVCFAGNVSRPEFSSLKPDLRGLAALPGAIAAARLGDDALLRYLIGQFEAEGFTVVGAQEVAGELLLAPGPIGVVAPADEHRPDLVRAWEIAGAVGGLDIGQGVVVCDGVVLAVEAQEGTDAMLRRCAELPEAIRGTPEWRRGVLVKRAKPIQERRVDLPTIGARTIEAAAAAGLAGVAGEAGGTLIVNRDEAVAAADRLGLFLYGFEPQA